jgi:phenylalanyl-tRNA synthetase beta chain
MAVLCNNTHVSYPQKIFEVGDCIVSDERAETGVREVRKLAGLLIHPRANFNEAKAVLDSFFLNSGIRYTMKASTHDSFIIGRLGRVITDQDVGFIGESRPSVLESWGLENPVAGFELDLDKMFHD